MKMRLALSCFCIFILTTTLTSSQESAQNEEKTVSNNTKQAKTKGLTMDILKVILPLLTAGAAWFFKGRLEELRAMEEKLMAERREIYLTLLQPFIILFANPAKMEENEKEMSEMVLSPEYMKTLMQFNLMASDAAINSFNEFSQQAFHAAGGKEIIKSYSTMMLEMRKSLGNKRTKLNNWDMLRAKITDIEEYIKEEHS